MLQLKALAKNLGFCLLDIPKPAANPHGLTQRAHLGMSTLSLSWIENLHTGISSLSLSWTGNLHPSCHGINAELIVSPVPAQSRTWGWQWECGAAPAPAQPGVLQNIPGQSLSEYHGVLNALHPKELCSRRIQREATAPGASRLPNGQVYKKMGNSSPSHLHKARAQRSATETAKQLQWGKDQNSK